MKPVFSMTPISQFQTVNDRFDGGGDGRIVDIAGRLRSSDFDWLLSVGTEA